MHLYVTKATGYLIPVPGKHGPAGVAVTPALAGDLELVEGMPFFLGDDGAYDPLLNRFLRSLPGDGAASRNTWLAYARDVLAYLDFLRQARGGKSWREATVEDLRAYKRARRDPNARHLLSAASWNRAVAGIEKLYRWALQERLIAQLPFTFTLRSVRTGTGGSATVEVNALKDRDDALDTVRYVTAEDYQFFRNVGLRGCLADGTEDPAWAGRFGHRNAVMGDLLVTTGLRIEEGSCFLAWEVARVTRPGAGQRQYVHRLPAAVGKGHRARDIFLTPRVHRLLLDYIDVERANALADARAADGSYQRIRDPQRVRRGGKRYVPLDGGDPKAVATLTATARARLVECGPGGEEPAWLFLADDGAPLGTGAWDKIFATACARCAEHGRPLHVTPHVLRHTYAVNYLSHLIRETTARVRPADLREPGARAYRRLYGDPLRILQKRMGHASIQSTFIYLDHLREARELADAAAERWDAMVAGGAADVA